MKRMKPALISAVLAMGCVAALAAGASNAVTRPQKDSSMQIIKDRVFVRAANVQEAKATEALKTLKPDGTWPDLDYADRTRGGWKPAKHLDRMRDMAAAYREPRGSLQNDAALREAVLRAFDAWTSRDPQSENWWNQEIGTPNALGTVMLLTEEHLSAEQKKAGLALLARAKIGMTGQNLVWLAHANILRGLLENDQERVAGAFARIWREVTDDQPEGVQPDASFHQHGRLLYTAGYGRGFASDVSRLMAIAAGTDFAAPPERVAVLERYILDGMQWMLRGGTFEPMARGREISRSGGGKADRELATVCANMLALNTARKAEYEAFSKRLLQQEPGAKPPLTGNRYFPFSTLMVHHNAAYYASVKLPVKGLKGTESGNGEAHLNHFLLYAPSFVMRRGDEYDGIYPVWDWRRVPGSTLPQIARPPVHIWGKDSEGQNDRAGAATDGSVGMAAVDFVRDGLSYKKAWAFFENYYVVLGADLRSTRDEPIVSSINQCHHRGPVTLSPPHDGRGQKDGITARLRWVHHDDIGYVFLQDHEVAVRAQPQEGSWKTINDHSSDKPLKLPVFSATIDHGTKPAETGAFLAYAVLPGKDAQATAAFAAKPPAIINTATAQAVYDQQAGIAMIAFHAAGQVGLPAGPTVQADGPCVLLVRQARGKTTVHAAALDPTTAQVRVTVDNAPLKATFPTGRQRGSTVQAQ